MNRQQWLGSGFALFSAITFALNMVLARVSYDYGANIHALNLSRAVFFLIVLGIVILVKNKPIFLSETSRWLSVAMGLLLCTEMYVLLAAIQTIPVALAVLIFYTYPLLLAVYGWSTATEKFSISSSMLLLAGFGGLVFVLINSPIELNPYGIGFSLIAALVMGAMLTISEINLRSNDRIVVLFYTLSTVVICISLFAVVLVNVYWPIGTVGWLAFIGSCLFYVTATFTLFSAVESIGPLRTAIIDNTSPVWAILFGYLLLEQVLTTKQLFGAVIVVCVASALQLTRKD